MLEPEQRKFRADPLKLKRLRVAAGLTAKEVRDLSHLDRTTVTKILTGKPVFLKSLSVLGVKVFNIDNPLELLHPDELHEMGLETELAFSGQVLEWEIEDYLSPWQQTTNGLQYQLVRLNHRYLNRCARGKCYELRHLTCAEKQRVQRYLLRHVEVCDRIGSHPHIAENITAAPVEGLWWVLDRWEDGITLAEQLAEGPLGDYTLRFVMSGMAEGLNALHKADIIRRELSPTSVLLREADDRPIITDMELAKLASGAPTVSPGQWPDDPYRAMEVGGDTPVDVRADLYSWGRIFVHAATGKLSERGEERLPNPEIPDVVRDVVIQCVAITRSQRPADMKAILQVLRRWE